jgi:hypothetical protein
MSFKAKNKGVVIVPITGSVRSGRPPINRRG